MEVTELVRFVCILFLSCFLAVLAGCTHNEQDDRIFYGKTLKEWDREKKAMSSSNGNIEDPDKDITDDASQFSLSVSDGILYFVNSNNDLYAIICDTGKLKWKFKKKNKVSSSPVVFKNEVYFGDNKGTLISLNAKNGRVQWKFKTDFATIIDPVISDNIILFGNRKNLYGIKTILGIFPVKKWEISEMFLYWGQIGISNGVAYFGCHESELCAVDIKTGNRIWSWEFESSEIPVSSPIVIDDMIYFESTDWSTRPSLKGLYAFDIKTKKIKWEFGKDSLPNASPTINDRILYSADSFGIIYAVSIKTGKQVWIFDSNTKTNLHQLPTSPPVVTNNTVYFVNVGGMLFALDAKTGKKKWQVDINDFQHGDSLQKPAFDNQNVYFASKDTVYALDLHTGTIKWNIKTN